MGRFGSKQYILTQAEDGSKSWVIEHDTAIRPFLWKLIPYNATAVNTTVTLTVPTLKNGTPSTLTAVVKNSSGAIVTGGTVVFATKIGSGSTVSSGSITNTTGTVTYSFTPSASGTATITASFTGAAGVTNDSSASKSATVAKKTVTNAVTVTTANWSESWDGSGSLQPDGMQNLYTGYYSSSRGSNRSWIGWTVAAIPSGATNIKATVRLKNDHWFNNLGGTLSYGVHSLTGKPSGKPSAPSITGSVWSPKNEYVTFTVAGWKASTKGIVLQAKTTSNEEYGYFSKLAANSTLTITYEV